MTALLAHDSEQGGLFDAIREGFAFVAERARHVRIRYDRIPAYAGALPGYPPFNVLDAQRHFTGNEEDTAAYILTLDAVNFGSGFAPAMAEEGWEMADGSIYFTLSTRLKERFEARGALTADELARFTAAEAVELLALPAGPSSREFARLCVESLRELGTLVEKGYDGRFMALVEAAGGSAEKMAALLAALPHFADVHDYQGRPVAFLKRAQIAAADLHLAFRRLGREMFTDIGRLTMFPDNAVPHVLRTDGILEYGEGLAARIAAGKNIPSGSEEEIEIRACAAHAVELIAAARRMKAMDVDHILWHRSEEDPRYAAASAHRTLSWFY